MDDQYIGKRCPACGLYLAECVLCTPAEVEAARRRKLAGPPVPATPSLEAIRRAASDDSWIPARMALPLVAEVERLTSERDTERALRIERDGLLAAERERFAVAHDAAQKLCRLAQEAFRTAIPFGTNPDDRDRSRAALGQAGAAVSAVLGVG